MSGTLSVSLLGRTAWRDSQVVAELFFAFGGRVIDVRRPGGSTMGRLVRSGPGGAYALWTALHTAAATPADSLLAPSVTLAEGIGLLLDREEGQTDG